ncbi:putative membrane-anchored protein [Agrobacterium vitis]|nr:putative membrane-anchored protein [Agrobacterium vitis]MBE1440530.1 putative membrane-anchored protein [Agrobacterium vitis]
MRHNRLFRLLCAAILLAASQTAVIGYQIGERAHILRTGVELRLKTEAVDPRDLLRGDYVVLSYPISRLRNDQIVGDRLRLREDVRFHVRLAVGADGFAVVQEASIQPLPAKPDTVVMTTEPVSFDPGSGKDDIVMVRYGIERFYVPEGEGREIESRRNQGAVTVAVRVSTVGQAQIRQLFIGNEPVYREPDF